MSFRDLTVYQREEIERRFAEHWRPDYMHKDRPWYQDYKLRTILQAPVDIESDMDRLIFIVKTIHRNELAARVVLSPFPGSPSYCVSTQLEVQSDHRGRDLSRVLFYSQLLAASRCGYKAIVAMVKDSNEIQQQRLAKFGWRKMPTIRFAIGEDSECSPTYSNGHSIWVIPTYRLSSGLTIGGEE